MSATTLLLFTQSFPYADAQEDTFLKDELPFMFSCFTEVVIFPLSSACSPTSPSVLPTVDLGLSNYLRKRRANAFSLLLSYLRSLLSLELLDEVISHRLNPFQHHHLRWFLRYQTTRRHVSRFISRWLSTNACQSNHYYFYTFWLDEATHGISDSLKLSPYNTQLISRCHGYDLYEDRYIPPYWPRRPQLLRTLSCLFPVSSHGTSYLQARYGNHLPKTITSYIGISPAPNIPLVPPTSTFTIVSCSFYKHLKRIPLILSGLQKVAEAIPSVQIHWTHYGNDTTEFSSSQLIEQAHSSKLPHNLTIDTQQFVSQDLLYSEYLNKPTDCFIHLSSAEGTPISIVEALNCFLPIIATSVGGVHDLVTPKNGVLLSSNPSVTDVATSLLHIHNLKTTNQLAPLQYASKEIWATHFDPSIVYPKFFSQILSL